MTRQWLWEKALIKCKAVVDDEVMFTPAPLNISPSVPLTSATLPKYLTLPLSPSSTIIFTLT